MGASNTLATYALLVALSVVLPLTTAYTVAFCAGLAYTAALSHRFVFRSERGPGAVVAFVAGYLMVYVVGQLLLRAVPSSADLPDWLLAAAVVLLTAPLSFLVGRATLGAGRRADQEAGPRPHVAPQEGTRQ